MSCENTGSLRTRAPDLLSCGSIVSSSWVMSLLLPDRSCVGVFSAGGPIIEAVLGLNDHWIDLLAI